MEPKDGISPHWAYDGEGCCVCCAAFKSKLHRPGCELFALIECNLDGALYQPQ
jgi:hypothetical protein